MFPNLEELIKKAKFERNPSGHIILDGQEVAATLQCCHCQAHFISVRGSGIKRGWCLCCNQVTCGAPGCDRCVPFEKKLEEMERCSEQ